MKRFNRFKAKDSKAIFTTKAMGAVRLRGSFAIQDYLITNILATNKYWVDLIHTEYTDEDIVHTFLINTDKRTLFIKCCKDKISIHFRNITLEYAFDYVGIDSYCTNLINQQNRFTEKMINIEYPNKNQYMIIEIIFNSKKFVFKTIYDTTENYSTDLLRTISFNSSIMDLKKFFMDNFYIKQSNYEKGNDTIISIYELINGEYVIKDELTIIDGHVINYLLSSIKDNVIISAKGEVSGKPEITIMNYTPSNIDLTKEANQLLVKIMGLK
ncbi:MAG: hypothetical protein E7163_00925 [Firmicutes bacterium]|nr:hypothetical protein [Bacillota bacterium]